MAPSYVLMQISLCDVFSTYSLLHVTRAGHLTTPDRPNLTHDEAVTVLSERFSIKSQAANMKSFPSYDDQNIYVKAEDGEEYVLKVYNSLLNGNNTEILECQNQLRSFISKDNISTPKPISATDDAKSQSIVIEIERDGTMNEWFALLLTFIPGKVMGTIRSPSHSLLANVGSYLGRMDKVRVVRCGREPLLVACSEYCCRVVWGDSDVR